MKFLFISIKFISIKFISIKFVSIKFVSIKSISIQLISIQLISIQLISINFKLTRALSGVLTDQPFQQIVVARVSQLAIFDRFRKLHAQWCNVHNYVTFMLRASN